MDNENLNNIPETEIPETEAEETAAAEAVEAAESAAEEAEQSEAEETVSEPAGSEEETSEETAEDKDGEEADEENGQTDSDSEEDEAEQMCPGCNANPVASGHQYCRKCERKYVKTHIGFFRYVAGAVALFGSFFAFVLVSIAALPSLQVFEGLIYEKGKIAYSAVESYRGTDEVVSSVQEALGANSFTDRFLRTGSGLDGKLFRATVKFYNPLMAEQYKQYIFDSPGAEKYKAHSKAVAENTRIYKKYEDTYLKLQNVYDGILNSEDPGVKDGEKALAEIDALRGQEGVDDVILNLFAYDIAGMCGMGDEKIYGCLDKTYEERGKSDVDWSFLYYDPYIDSLIARDRDDEALALTEELAKKDISNEKPFSQQAKIYVKKGDVERAEEIVNTYCANNLTKDGTFSDSGYQMLIWLARIKGDYKELAETKNAAEQLYDLIPEYNRQQALAYLIEGKYDDAYEQAYLADEKAYYRASYYNDTSALTEEIYATLYVSAVLCDKYGEKNGENAEHIPEIIESFKTRKFSGDNVEQIVSGKLDVKDVLTKGGYDLI